MPVSHEDAALVLAVRAGDEGAFTTLFQRWSDRCFDVARRIVHEDAAAADVTQDTFLTAWRRLDTLRDPAAFGGWVLRMSRNGALKRLERDGRMQPTDATGPVLVGVRAGDEVEEEVTDAMSTTAQHDLVWAASAALGEREASVLDLHLRHGMSAAEIGEELGVTTNNAHQLLFRMKKKLGAGIRAWVLFRGGDASCELLRAELAAAGVAGFGKEAVGVVDAHVPTCEACERRQSAVLAPESMFAAAPMLVIGAAMRSSIADALRGEGVPLGPEATTPIDPGSGDGPADDQTVAGRDGGEAAVRAGERDGGEPRIDEDDPPTDDRRRRRAAVILAVLLGLLVGGGVLWSVAGGDDRGDVETVAGPVTTSTSAAKRSTTTEEVAPSTVAPTTSVASTSTALASPGSTTTPGSLAPDPATTQPRSSPPTTDPGVFTPVSPVTTTRPPATTTTTPPAPRIDSFTATPAGAPGGPCAPGQWATTLAWTTTHATAAKVTATGVSTISGLAPDGSRVVCRPTPSAPPGGWTLTATGPGGADTDTA